MFAVLLVDFFLQHFAHQDPSLLLKGRSASSSR